MVGSGSSPVMVRNEGTRVQAGQAVQLTAGMLQVSVNQMIYNY